MSMIWLRNPDICRDSFKRLFKAHLFSTYWTSSKLEDWFYAETLRFTYLLTFAYPTDYDDDIIIQTQRVLNITINHKNEWFTRILRRCHMHTRPCLLRATWDVALYKRRWLNESRNSIRGTIIEVQHGTCISCSSKKPYYHHTVHH